MNTGHGQYLHTRGATCVFPQPQQQTEYSLDDKYDAANVAQVVESITADVIVPSVRVSKHVPMRAMQLLSIAASICRLVYTVVVRTC